MKLADLKNIVKILRPLYFAGDGKVATFSLPSFIRDLNKLKSGDKVEIIFDLRKPREFRVVIKKKVVENAGQG